MKTDTTDLFPLRRTKLYSPIRVENLYADESEFKWFFSTLREGRAEAALEILNELGAKWQVHQLLSMRKLILNQCNWREPTHSGHPYFELNSRIKEYLLNIGDAQKSFFRLKWFLTFTTVLKDLTPFFTGHSFTLTEQSFSPEGMKSFAASLAGNKTLTALCLRSPNWSPNLLSLLVDGVSKNKSITTLDLGCNNFDEKCGVQIGRLLLLSSSLKQLKLDDNQRLGDGLVAVAYGLAKNNTLARLSLKYSHLNESCLKTFGKALEMNHTLEFLEMIWCKFSSESVQHLAAGLIKNQSLTYFSLSNQIGDLGAQALAVVLRNNQTLKHLILYNGEIGNVGLRELTHALAANHTLETLNLQELQPHPFERSLDLDAELLFNHHSLIRFVPPDDSMQQYLGGPVFQELQETQLIKAEMDKEYILSLLCFFSHPAFVSKVSDLIYSYLFPVPPQTYIENVKTALVQVPRQVYALSEILDLRFFSEQNNKITFISFTLNIRQMYYIGKILAYWLSGLNSKFELLFGDYGFVLNQISVSTFITAVKDLFFRWNKDKSTDKGCNNFFPIVSQAIEFNLAKKTTELDSLRGLLGDFFKNYKESKSSCVSSPALHIG